MSDRTRSRVVAYLLVLCIFLGLVSPVLAGEQAADSNHTAQSPSIQSSSPPTGPQPTIRQAVRYAESAELRSMRTASLPANKPVAPEEIPFRPLPNRGGLVPKDSTPLQIDPVIQVQPGEINMPATEFNFQGLSNEDNASLLGFYLAPPDTIGAPGFDPATNTKYYVQWVNLVLAVWDISGPSPVQVMSPIPGNALWAGFGGICEFNNDGDIIVLFDELANRWLLSQFALDFGGSEFHQCIAVSTSADPTGSWHLYDFLISTTKMNDYPKFGIWPDGYYMAVNQFTGGVSWGGQGVVAFERDRMMAGDPAAQMVYFDLPENGGGMLPSDLDGLATPPAGTPNIFVQVEDDAWGAPDDWLRVWEFDVDWLNPLNSTFTEVAQLPTAPFDSQVCPSFRDCIDQPNGLKLDAISDRLMYRLQYRNFGDHQALVTNHTVNGGSNQAGVRWYELRNTGAGWSIYQQGTYAPDTEHRWMGSAALDQSGNLALGYSLSSSQTHPAIRYTGRLAGDPLNTLPQTESEAVTGSFSQEGTFRWGDYSTMALDPTDNCTFWFTQEYAAPPNAASWGNWTTQIFSFRYPTCTSGPRGDLEGTITDLNSGLPVAGALVDLGNGVQTNSDEAGGYQVFGLPAGDYTVAVSNYGYLTGSALVTITDGAVTVQDFALEPAPPANVSGMVSDLGHGFPLYAQIDISTLGHQDTMFSDPATGMYTANLFAGIDYTFEVHAVSPGYLPEIRPVSPPAGDSTEDFGLSADLAACNAPGYELETVYQEDFEADEGGYLVSGSFTSWQWGTPTSGPGSAHSGANAWATNLSGNYSDGEFGEITSPAIDLSAYAGQMVILYWWQWLQTESGFDYASVEVSNDNGGTWNTYFGPDSGEINTDWTQYTVFLDPSYATSGFQVRFHLDTDFSVTYPGFYVDDVALAVVPAPTVYYSENFEADDGGYAVSGANTSWEWGPPTRSPASAHSGLNAWGTDLDDNYGNNEDGAITSPDIDLSAAAGQPTLLTWWSWFQSEFGYDNGTVDISGDGGASWANLLSMTGIWNTEWSDNGYYLDPAYSVSNFRIRFTFTSDNTVTYPGFSVDDVSIRQYTTELPTPPCVAIPGGLVVGHVYDANLSGPLDGATISSAAGHSTTSFPTPLDPAVPDGLYLLFSPPGLDDFTASKSGGYGSDTAPVTVPLNDSVSQDFFLPAGWLTAAPGALTATLPMDATTTMPLTLTNSGGLTASFELAESGGGMSAPLPIGAPVRRLSGSFTPYRSSPLLRAPDEINRPIPRPDVPPWTDIAEYPRAIMDNTAAELDGIVYSVGGFDGTANIADGYMYDPSADAWTPIASMANGREKPAAAMVEGLLYVVGGWDNFSGEPVAALEIYDPASDTWSSGPPVPIAYAAATGVSLSGKFYVIGGCSGFGCGVTDVFVYDPATTTWSTAAPYPEPTSWQACGVIDGLIYCAGGVSDALGESLHTYVYDPAADSWTPLADMPQTQWATGYTSANGFLYISGGVTNNFNTVTNETFVYDPVANSWTPDANANNLVYRGASACGFYRIGGSAGGFSPIPNSEVYPGLTDCGEAVDVPWLSQTPITGTLTAGNSQVISVTFDTTVPEIVQPGTYTALIKAKEDTPYASPEIEVNMEVTPPATWGRVTGVISGLDYCDAAGLPLPGAEIAFDSVPLTSSGASGEFTYWLEEGTYTLTASAPGYVMQSQPVTVTAALATSVDIDLRLDAPCTSYAPATLEVSLPVNTTMTTTLELTNSGAGELGFTILESALSLVPAAPVAAGSPAPAFSPAALLGPASVRLQVDGSVRSPLSPESGWFAGLDMPGGAVRYAHAQCFEDPNSIYVFSGVDGSFTTTTNAWHYDAALNEWTELAPIPSASEGPTAACYFGNIYVMGGNGTNQFYIYNIASDTWSAGPALPRPVWGAAAAAWAGKVYLVGGDADFFFGGPSTEVNIYDIATGTWSSGEPLPVGVSAMGFVQTGPWLYLVGGWGELAPSENTNTTQRYNLDNDVWEIGPEFTSARADFALSATSQALYAIGGDLDSGGAFDATNLVERLDLTAWPSGGWSDTSDPLPVAVTSNNAGFCTSGLFPAEVRSVGGFNTALGVITGDNRFRIATGETCYSIFSDIPWLGKAPEAGTVVHDSELGVAVSFNATGLAQGEYTATLVIPTSDPAVPLLLLSVRMVVTGPVYYLRIPLVSKGGTQP